MMQYVGLSLPLLFGSLWDFSSWLLHSWLKVTHAELDSQSLFPDTPLASCVPPPIPFQFLLTAPQFSGHSKQDIFLPFAACSG